MMSDTKGGPYHFLPGKDSLACTINQKANELFLLLKHFDTERLTIDESFKFYFTNHHLGHRLFFSIQNSCHIIYQSVMRTRKQVDEINIVDYGAGLGTLYMLCGMLHFKRVIYNDYLPDWKATAQLISEALEIPITGFVTGDIDAVLHHAAAGDFEFDIIASRNVIEHIYNLPLFYALIHKHNPSAVVFSTTTANYHNPAMRLRHYLIHQKTEKESYSFLRKEAIQKAWTTITPPELTELTKKTRGKAKEDLFTAIENFRQHKSIDPVPFLRSNTCEPSSGYWCEHLLTKNEYEIIITMAGFKMEYSAGYWDTHYRSGMMNIIAVFLNKLIVLFGKRGYVLSPFVNVIAYT